MSAYRTRGGTMNGQKMPSHSTLLCDAEGCRSYLDGEGAVVLRKAAREMGWGRMDGQDYCPEHRGE